MIESGGVGGGMCALAGRRWGICRAIGQLSLADTKLVRLALAQSMVG